MYLEGEGTCVILPYRRRARAVDGTKVTECHNSHFCVLIFVFRELSFLFHHESSFVDKKKGRVLFVVFSIVRVCVRALRIARWVGARPRIRMYTYASQYR